MPTPTIDPAAYEAAYAAIEQYQTNRGFSILIFTGIIGFIFWLVRGDD